MIRTEQNKMNGKANLASAEDNDSGAEMVIILNYVIIMIKVHCGSSYYKSF